VKPVVDYAIKHEKFIRALAVMVFATVASRTQSTQAAETSALQPFVGTFAVEWRGINAGTSTLELKRTGTDTYAYTSSNVARGMFKVAFPDAITQVSVFRLDRHVVTPVSYRADDGSADTKRDITLDFDWKKNRVTGVAENEPVDVALEPGVQDSLSVQIALVMELAAGRSPSNFKLIDKKEIKEYLYTREGTATVDTSLGKLETVIYSSQRAGGGSSRTTKLWLAPSLGFLPVRAEQTRKGKSEFVMSVRTLEREGG